jgi:hypothetical protein
VFTSDGESVGVVEQVLGEEGTDIFDGLAIDTRLWAPCQRQPSSDHNRDISVGTWQHRPGALDGRDLTFPSAVDDARFVELVPARYPAREALR